VLIIPQRDAFVSRDTFADAYLGAFNSLWTLYEALPVESREPEWTRHGQGVHVFNVSLPQSMGVVPDYAVAGLNSLIKNLMERNKSIKRLARVERDGVWYLWAETN
jgi:hypothetical protein